MAEEPVKPNENIPAFRVSEKKVDSSWKEEVRREREKAEQAATPRSPVAEPAGAAPAAASAGARVKGGGGGGVGGGEGGREKQSPQQALEQQQSKIFLSFMANLVQQTLIQLGDIPNPFSGQREVDLQGARYTIEVLSVIQAKTKNSLTAEEEEFLTGGIGDLKMRYVEIANEVQRQMQAEAQKAAARGPQRPGPGGTISGPGFGKRR